MSNSFIIISLRQANSRERQYSLVPKHRSRRYTQVLEVRHSGHGFRNPASMDGKLGARTDALCLQGHEKQDGKLVA